jgi:ribosomal protein L14E/L6E/L27E
MRATCPLSSAILAAPPFLSGLSAKQSANAREAAARKFAPAHYDQLVATEKVIDRVKAASQSFVRRYRKALALRNTPKAKADDRLAKLKMAG